MAGKKGTGGGGNKQSGDKVSSVAAKVLGGKKPTPKEAKALAGSVLSQDQTKGKRPKK